MNMLIIKKIVKLVFSEYWRELLIVLLGGMVWYQNAIETRFIFFIDTIPYLHNQIDIHKENLETCKMGNDALAKAIDDRNSEVLKWKQISNELETKNKQLIQQQLELKQDVDAQVNKILKEKTPTTCKSAIDYLRNSTKELLW